MDKGYVIHEGRRFAVGQPWDDIQKAAEMEGFTVSDYNIMQPGGTPDNDYIAKVVAKYFPVITSSPDYIELTRYCMLGITVPERLVKVLKKLNATPL